MNFICKHLFQTLTFLIVLVNAMVIPCEAATTYFPGQGEFGTILVEDQWPNAGDFDFNDAVLRTNVTHVTDAANFTTNLQYTLKLQAFGSNEVTGFGLRLPVISASLGNVTLTTSQGASTVDITSSGGDTVLWISDDLRSDFCPGCSGVVNTNPTEPHQNTQQVILDISFAAPVQLDSSQAPFDIFFYRSGDRTHQIHRPEYYGTDNANPNLFNTQDDASDPSPPQGSRWYVNEDGMPWVLYIPEDVSHPDFPGLAQYPIERESIDIAFPNIVGFAASGGTSNQDWYNFPDVSKLYSPVPEPSTMILSVMGLIVLAFFSRRKI